MNYITPHHFTRKQINKRQGVSSKINQLPIDNVKEIVALEKELLGKTGNELYITPPLHVDYGRHIEVGENFMQIWIAFFRCKQNHLR